MAIEDRTHQTALVTGASRGFGRAIAVALRQAGVDVVAVARGGDALEELRADLGGELTTVVADVTDSGAARELLARHRPQILVLNAGATPAMAPLQEQTWETFSRNWDVDVRQAFDWIREALLLPLAPGSTVIVMSSGAALFGSPLSGGYAGAKATVRFITAYAANEAARAGLDIRFVAVMPKITGDTRLGGAAVDAYAARDGISREEYFERVGPGPRPEDVARHVVDLASSSDREGGAFVVTPQGLAPAP